MESHKKGARKELALNATPTLPRTKKREDGNLFLMSSFRFTTNVKYAMQNAESGSAFFTFLLLLRPQNGLAPVSCVFIVPGQR